MLKALLVVALIGALGAGPLGAAPVTMEPPWDHGGEDPDPGSGGDPPPAVDAENEGGSVTVRIEVAGSTVGGGRSRRRRCAGWRRGAGTGAG